MGDLIIANRVECASSNQNLVDGGDAPVPEVFFG